VPFPFEFSKIILRKDKNEKFWSEDSIQVYIAKTDSKGNRLWSLKIGGTNYDVARSIQQTKDNGFIVVGWTSSFVDGKANVYLIKTEPDSLGISNENSEIPESKKPILYQNFPNPFNPSTTIKYSIAQKSKSSLKIYNINGELVKILVDKINEAGTYSVNWDGLNDGGRSVSSGVYLCKLIAGNYAESQKMILIR
jgi:hypothetical protein